MRFFPKEMMIIECSTKKDCVLGSQIKPQVDFDKYAERRNKLSQDTFARHDIHKSSSAKAFLKFDVF